MCGIAGFFSVGGRFNEDQLKSMTRALAHRGPDAEGYFFEQPVGLGHRRLAILDLDPRSNQPMTDRSGRYTIVYNGEVYNYKAIAKRYKLDLRTTSDTEVILEAFVMDGINAVRCFNGMFAFAVYDRLEKALFIFRDPVGIKPLVYYYDGSNFAFASELKGLLTLPLEKKLNLTALQDYLFLEYIPAPLTIFENFYKLTKGHYIKISANGLELHPFSRLIDWHSAEPSEGLSEFDHIERLKSVLTSTVVNQRVSDVPVGAFLSGGTDSSLLVAMLQQVSPIAAFTIGFDEAKYDESGYARAVAGALGAEHKLSRLTIREGIEEVSQIANTYDEPFAVSSVVPMLLLCRTARQNVMVAISGDGGDELFMGYGYYFWHDRVKQISKFGGSFARKLAGSILRFRGERGRHAAERLDYNDYETIWLHVWSQEQQMFTQKEITQLLGKPYKHQTLKQSWADIQKLPIHPYEKISLFDLDTYLANDLLYKVDMASMAYGLEVRVPYLDHEVIRLALSLPTALKIKAQTQKYILKKLLERYLPPELVYRKKWGFPAPFEVWLKTDLAYLSERYLSKSYLEKQGLFNSAMVRQVFDDFRSGKTRNNKKIWALLYFQLWVERYFSP